MEPMEPPWIRHCVWAPVCLGLMMTWLWCTL